MSETTSSPGTTIGQIATAIGEALYTGGAIAAEASGAEIGVGLRFASAASGLAMAA